MKRQGINRICIVFLLFISLFSMVSCNRKLAWTFADNLVAMNLQSHFAWSGSQKSTVRPLIDQAKHKLEKQLFPQLSEEVLALATKVKEIKNVDEAEKLFLTSYDQTEGVLKKIIKIIEPEVMQVAAIIDQKSWANFKTEFDEQNEKINKENQDPNKRKKKMLKNMESFFDDLTDPQEKIIEKYVQSTEGLSALRVENRKYILSQFEKQIVQDPFSVKAATQKWLVDYMEMRTPEYKTKKSQQRIAFGSMVRELYPTLSDAQKNYAVGQLQEIAQQLKEFSQN